jgi:hypothetical protein
MTKSKTSGTQTVSPSAAAVAVANAKPPAAQVTSHARVPAAQNVSPSAAAVMVTNTKPPFASITPASGAIVSAVATTSNAAAAPVSSQVPGLTTANAATGTIAAGLPHGYTPQPVPDPQKDIEKQRQVIKQAEDDNAKLQQMKSDVLGPTRAVFDRSHFSQAFCESDGCFRYFSTDKFGGPGLFIKVRVDAKGHPLPQEFDREVAAQKEAIDIVIANDTQLIVTPTCRSISTETRSPPIRSPKMEALLAAMAGPICTGVARSNNSEACAASTSRPPVRKDRGPLSF